MPPGVDGEGLPELAGQAFISNWRQLRYFW
jgi:hypothetical protein